MRYILRVGMLSVSRVDGNFTTDRITKACKIDSRRICLPVEVTMKAHFGCPVQATSNVFSGKWKVLIVWHLAFRSLRHAELLRLLPPGVSRKVLTAQLRELENDGVIARLDAETATPRVDYFLTESGKELINIMDAMCAWATKHLGVAPTLPPRPELIPTQPSGN
jgi:DNA-binding HxlR family transcriptional regulator